jgi:hypothetical protein
MRQEVFCIESLSAFRLRIAVAIFNFADQLKFFAGETKGTSAHFALALCAPRLYLASVNRKRIHPPSALSRLHKSSSGFLGSIQAGSSILLCFGVLNERPSWSSLCLARRSLEFHSSKKDTGPDIFTANSHRGNDDGSG